MKRISRALVIANRNKPIALQVQRQARQFLLSRGVSPSSRPQLIVTVGGDGTVLFSKKHYGLPFFAIGSRTSFLCQATFSNWRKKLSKFLLKPKAERRLLLECSLNGRKLPLALNEIGIRNPEPRLFSLHLSAMGKQFAFRADGILFSTPTGSPAYCYSCGGGEMRMGERRYQAVAISPFRRTFKPLMLPAAKPSTLRISGPERAQLFIDGQVVGSFSEKDKLSVKGSRQPFWFAKA